MLDLFKAAVLSVCIRAEKQHSLDHFKDLELRSKNLLSLQSIGYNHPQLPLVRRRRLEKLLILLKRCLLHKYVFHFVEDVPVQFKYLSLLLYRIRLVVDWLYKAFSDDMVGFGASMPVHQSQVG